MNVIKILTTIVLFTASASTFAYSYYHPVTGDLVFDENSYEFSGNCVNADGTVAVEASFNADGSLDLLFDDFNLNKAVEDRTSKNCQFKIDLAVPAGWIVIVTTEAAVGGLYFGTNAVTLEHTFAGTTRQAAYEFLNGQGTFAIDQALTQVGYSSCGSDETLKTIASIYSFTDTSFISLSSGSVNGSTKAWKYYWNWVRC